MPVSALLMPHVFTVCGRLWTMTSFLASVKFMDIFVSLSCHIDTFHAVTVFIFVNIKNQEHWNSLKTESLARYILLPVHSIGL